MKFPIKDVDLFSSVVIEKERVVFSASDFGKNVCALVPIEDYERLEALSDLEEGNEALKILQSCNQQSDYIDWKIFDKELSNAIN